MNSRALCGLALAVIACGGGGGSGGSNSTPTTPVDNSVARVDVSPSTPLNLVSGATASLTATAFTRDGRALSGQAPTWISSDSTIAGVAAGLVTARLAGNTAVLAQIGGISSAAVGVTVTAGAPAQLVVRTAPAGAASGLVLTAQPAVDVRDAAGNVVTSSTPVVTVALASGGGTLGGTTTVNAVAGVASFSGLSITGKTGARTLAFAAAGLSGATSAPFTLAPGTATQLAIGTPPVAGTAYAPFPTPAAIEVHDGADNVVTSFTAAVTATIASGGGTLGGTVTVPAVAGVARFTTLTINGSAGARTLTFASGALTSVTTSSLDVATAPPAAIAFSPSAAALTTSQGSNPAAASVTVTNAGVFPLTNLRVQGITYGAGPAGWLAAQFAAGTAAPAAIRLTATTNTMALGTFTATVQVAGDGAAVSPVPLVVTLQVVPAIIITYGQATTKTSIVNVGATVSPVVAVTDGTGAPSADPTLGFASRAPAVATVDATGRVTAVAAGETWVAATSQRATTDSVFVIVPRTATDAMLRTDLTQFSFRAGDTVTARVILDTRGTKSLGAITAAVSWTNDFFTGALTLLDVSTTTSTIAPVYSVDNAIGVIRLSAASSAGVSGAVELARIRFIARTAGRSGWIYLNATELLAADFSDLLPAATLTQFPVIVR